MASIKRGSNQLLDCGLSWVGIMRAIDQKNLYRKRSSHPKSILRNKAEKWVKEQAILFEREVQHTPEPINRSITLAKYIEHWVADVGPKKRADSTFRRDEQDIRRILPALGNYKLIDLRKEVIRDFTKKCGAARVWTAEEIYPRSRSKAYTTRCAGILSALWTRDTTQSGVEMLQTERKKKERPSRRRNRSEIDCRFWGAKA